ncbi:MAG: TIGR04283 family arsenosugar biosynthesis glycosyltransferase [Bacteroidetes bacterium]|nr:TIGR04283 family arsenosugar biosynthesis glycosyltransferase [Bacteroidota bacterium]
MNKISIIIPILNEAKTIGKLLQHLLDNSSKDNISDIIVVDGGSTDGSMEIVNAFVTSSDSDLSESYREEDPETSSGWTCHNIKFMTSPKGRAKQMNFGAKDASGDILYFLHADSFPPKDFDYNIIRQVKKGSVAGCFRMKFDSTHPVLKISQWFTRYNFKICRGGDQSLFIVKKIFYSLDGYNETFGVYEDCQLINRIYDNYSFTIINDYVTTSARRYAENGTWKLQYHFAVIHLKKWLGASAEELHRYYKQHIV